MTLYTERLKLVLTEESMIDEIMAYFKRNEDLHGAYQTERPPDFYTAAFQKKLVTRALQNSEAGTGYRFWLRIGDDPKIIGVISISDVVKGPYQSCKLGYSLDEAYQGHEYAAEAATRVIDFIFQDLKLHRIQAFMMPRNTRSVQLAERLHFQYEGLARDYLYINGVWEDHKCMALIREADEL